ncbi:MAG: GTP-binding protein [Deltaproteobacteria bacterium]|nr:GTP-binding protein [Deltaproteobacteria bacterium]
MRRPHFPVAVLGHQGHGKSTLCAALALATGGQPLRGDPLDVRTCRAVTTSKRITLLDAPGGRRSVNAALRACAVADAAVLVVSSTLGPQAQTRDHILAARAAGLSIIVVINDFRARSGSARDRELLEACEFEVRGLLLDHGAGGDDAVVIIGADDDVNAGGVLAALDALPVTARDDEAAALVRVLFFHSRLSSAAGVDRREGQAIASGRVLAGTLKPGDSVRVLGLRGRIDGTCFCKLEREAEDARVRAHDVVARVSRLEIEGADVGTAHAGEHVGVQLAFPGAAPIVDRQSSMLVAATHAGPSTVLTARLTLRPAAIGGRAHPLLAGFECLAWTGSTSTTCVVLPINAGGDDVVGDVDGSFDAAIVLGLPRYAPLGAPLVLTGDGGLVASGVVVEGITQRDAAGWFDRLNAVRTHHAARRTGARRRRALVGAVP